MESICKKEQPNVCLECVAGDTTGKMLQFMGEQATCILYGLLSQESATIDVMSFISKN
jgi:NADPH:quinone reductase-like Zn-dependent oxidoreductase